MDTDEFFKEKYEEELKDLEEDTIHKLDQYINSQINSNETSSNQRCYNTALIFNEIKNIFEEQYVPLNKTIREWCDDCADFAFKYKNLRDEYLELYSEFRKLLFEERNKRPNNEYINKKKQELVKKFNVLKDFKNDK